MCQKAPAPFVRPGFFDAKPVKRTLGQLCSESHSQIFIVFTFYNAFGRGAARKENLIGFGGILFYILVSLAISVKWRPVVWGFGLQYCCAVIGKELK